MEVQKRITPKSKFLLRLEINQRTEAMKQLCATFPPRRILLLADKQNMNKLFGKFASGLPFTPVNIRQRQIEMLARYMERRS